MIKKEGNAKLMAAVAQNMPFQKKVKTVNFANTCPAQHIASTSEATKGPGANKTNHDHSIGNADSATSFTAPQTSHLSQTVGN